MLGDGIVSLGRAEETFSRTNSKSSPKIVSRERELRVDVGGRRRPVVLAVLVVEVHADRVVLDLVDAAELVDEVHVPGLAAELAVGRGLEADLLLAPDDLADRLVLQPAQLGVVDAAGGVVLAGLQKLLRAQQAADVVGSERWLGSHDASCIRSRRYIRRPMPSLLSSSNVRVGAVRGRYFRENFAQGGIDLVQIVPELVTNADAAIAATGRERGRIELRFGAPDAAFMGAWRAQMRALRVPALMGWRFEVRCGDDGVGVDAATIDRRLGILGGLPDERGSRGLFGRGLRDVWLAQGAGRIQGARDGRAVESWFFPAAGDDPYAYIHVRDDLAPDAAPGTKVTVPLAAERLPAEGRLRTLVAQLVQLRPVLEDPARELWLELPSGAAELARVPTPEPDPQRPVLFDDEVAVTGEIRARVTVRRSARPLSPGMSRATRIGGLVVRSGRAAHESTFASFEGSPGTRSLYGEVRCDALDDLQRDALERPRPQVVVRVDRSGLNDNHPVVKALYASIDRVLRPIVAAEERQTRCASRPPRQRVAGARPGRPARAQRRAEERLRHARQGGLPGRRRAERARAAGGQRADSAAIRAGRRGCRRPHRRAPRCASSSR